MHVKISTSSETPAEACDAERIPGEQLERLQSRLDEAVSLELAETFRLLSDPGRVRLIAALLDADELCVCDLSDATGLSQTACSHNLRLLRAQRLVRHRRQGRNIFYALDDEHIRVLLHVALQHVTHE
ncbi:MAG: winged helix-turn-helix transcriptional regulator [Actinobacteria bacterium]|nr:winged helix-turn-helix transcriptional regulator [Actinomycetota bacterium]